MAEKAIEHGSDRGTIAEQLPQSSTGRLEVKSVLARSQRRMTISPEELSRLTGAGRVNGSGGGAGGWGGGGRSWRGRGGGRRR